MLGIASAATSVVIRCVAAGTERIRVGAGGIMLPNHSPLVIAEQFGTLESLYPGRIDLVLGRAPSRCRGTSRRSSRRSFCPSCGGRRMAETAALLVDEVLPRVPTRQWVLSLPLPLRYLLATRPEVVTQVLSIVYRAISDHLIPQGRPDARAGQDGRGHADPALRPRAQPQHPLPHALPRRRPCR